MLEELLLRPVLTFLLKLCFRVEVRGREHYYAAGERVLIIANHLSYLDPLILGVFIPEKPSFAINVYQADKWYFRWLDKWVRLYRLDPSKPLSMKRLIQDLRANAETRSTKVVVFPEGRISTSGGIMKIYDGTGMILEKTGATLLPVRIDGPEYSALSRIGTKLQQRLFPKITVTFLPPARFAQGEKISAQNIYDVMTTAAFASAKYYQPFLQSVLDAYALHGGSHPIACDIARTDSNYRQLFTRAFILSGKLRGPLDGQNNVGVLLPSAVAAMVTFLSLHILGKIPCMLNFSAGEKNIVHACHIATIKTVLTSRAFIEKGKLEAIVEALTKDHFIIYLEDIRPTITLVQKLSGLGKALFASIALTEVLARTKPNDPAVILYTSGSEGTPKGVALSHVNILSNIAQVRARLDLTTSDKLFNALPVFHSFGLAIGMLMPMTSGIKTFLYPTPLHYRIIPELMYDTDCTIMLGTDTFYNGYAHYAHQYDFWNIRLAVAGAEKLRESTRKLYSDKFRINIIEGYGVTEASPVVSVNTPMEHKAGSVGRALPGIDCRIENIAGLQKGGRLFIKGPNVMLGYLNNNPVGSASDSTGSCAIAPQFTGLSDEWYDTGDIVDIDAEGFITILGRAKRFAKIGGEMVSLMVVEDMAANLIEDKAHAAISIPDARKGEQIVLFTESEDLSKAEIVKHAREQGIAEICLPKHVVFLEVIPRLGNGKIDYVTLAQKEIELP